MADEHFGRDVERRDDERIGANGDEIAVGEVGQAQDAEQQADAECSKGVKAAQA